MRPTHDRSEGGARVPLSRVWCSVVWTRGDGQFGTALERAVAGAAAGVATSDATNVIYLALLAPDLLQSIVKGDHHSG